MTALVRPPAQPGRGGRVLRADPRAARRPPGPPRPDPRLAPARRRAAGHDGRRRRTGRGRGGLAGRADVLQPPRRRGPIGPSSAGWASSSRRPWWPRSRPIATTRGSCGSWPGSPGRDRPRPPAGDAGPRARGRSPSPWPRSRAARPVCWTPSSSPPLIVRAALVGGAVALGVTLLSRSVGRMADGRHRRCPGPHPGGPPGVPGRGGVRRRRRLGLGHPLPLIVAAVIAGDRRHRDVVPAARRRGDGRAPRG